MTDPTLQTDEQDEHDSELPWDEEAYDPALWSGWRWPATLAAMTASLSHLPVMDEHLSDAAYMGSLFAIFSLVVLALAAGLLLADTAVRYSLLGGWCVLAVATYCATRLVAFPDLADDVGNWTEMWGVISVAAELAVAGCCAAAVLAERRARAGEVAP